MERKWLAHIAEDGREQTVLEHLNGTAEYAARFADAFGAKDQGTLIGMAHDIGKYTDAFQMRLHGSSYKVDHATAGAYECAHRKNIPAAFCVSGHHGGLPDGGGKGDVGTATLMARLKKVQNGQVEDYSAWKQEVSLNRITLPLWCRQDKLSAVFYTRMLYSCLVDADFLDTQRFMDGELPQSRYPSTEELCERLDYYISGWFPPKGMLNKHRCEILHHCIERGETSSPGLFTLTVPTGGGKTVSSLAFALHHAKINHLSRVIYVIPYTSIIEQTADIFRTILGNEVVLEHHSGVLIEEEPEQKTPSQQTCLLAQTTENWDIPVVVTTAVQFFESLYANRSSKCRKLHNIANSVLIFDEAQMMPLSYLRPCVSAVSQLVAHYGVSAVLCTATQPALEPLFQEFLPHISPQEICPQTMFEDEIFQRVRFHQAGCLTWEALSEQLNDHPQVLCIVNSRKNAQKIYELLEGEGVFHLSTLMYPAHRRAILQTIRQRLKDGLPCRVVSTSLIEAGVDVDFPNVYREIAGLDSILQAAGRCNREGKRTSAESIVTIFKSEEAPPPLFSTAISAGEIVMESYENISSQPAITRYFTELRGLKGTAAQDQKEILKQLKEDNFPFQTVAEQFHLIENNIKTVYILHGKGVELLRRYQNGERSRSLFRALTQYSVSIYESHWKELWQVGDIERLEGTENYLLINPNLYSVETGLSLRADSGKALFI